jgi:hypothetical protein
MEVHGIEEWEYSRLNRRRDSTSTYKPTLEPPCCSRLNASILHRPARRSTNLEAIFRQLTILSFINYRSFRNGTRQEGRQDLKEDKALQEASVRPVSRSVPVDHVKAAKLTILFTCSSADMPVLKRHGESQRVLITEFGGWQSQDLILQQFSELIVTFVHPRRRRFKGQLPMPSIGYGTNAKHRHMMPNGLRKFLVNNPREVDLLLMHNKTYAAEIAHGVSSKKRIEILERAKVLGVKVTNARAKLRVEEA